MKRDLKSFKKAEEAAKNLDPKFEKSVKDSMNKSEGELMQDLMKSVAQGKKDGTFNDKKVKEFVDKVSPMLNAEQKKRMNQLLQKIK